jgi:hypothetical protein
MKTTPHTTPRPHRLNIGLVQGWWIMLIGAIAMNWYLLDSSIEVRDKSGLPMPYAARWPLTIILDVVLVRATLERRKDRATKNKSPRG